MEENITVMEFAPPPVDKSEILRYARVREATPEILALLEECLLEAQDVFTYKVVYRTFPMSCDRYRLSLGFGEYESEYLSHGIGTCTRIMPFVATVGQGIDFLIKRYEVLSPAKAHMLDAIGSERVESLCDAFCAYVEKIENEKDNRTRPRVSPGYGDIPFEMQKDIFAVLDCQRKIGIALGARYLMTPRKSVAAAIGM